MNQRLCAGVLLAVIAAGCTKQPLFSDGQVPKNEADGKNTGSYVMAVFNPIPPPAPTASPSPSPSPSPSLSPSPSPTTSVTPTPLPEPTVTFTPTPIPTPTTPVSSNELNPKLIASVMGLRSVAALNSTQIELTFGGATNNTDPVGGFQNTQGFNIYSPDDNNYAFTKFIEPTAIENITTADSVAGIGQQSTLVKKHTIRLTLPYAISNGSLYYVLAIGGKRSAQGSNQYRVAWQGNPVTSGRTAMSFMFGSSSPLEQEVSTELIQKVLGIRSVEVVGNQYVKLIFGGDTDHLALNSTTNFLVSSPTDTNYQAAKSPQAVGRISGSEFFIPKSEWPFKTKFFKHEVFLKLPFTLKQNTNYLVSVPASVTGGRNAFLFTFSDLDTINPHIKVNQEGYVDTSPAKWALLGGWMGSLGTMDYASVSTFKIYSATTLQEVYSGTPTLYFRGNPTRAQRDTEGPYALNTTFEDVYKLEFSSVTTPGTYFVSIPGMGRSLSFVISKNAYANAFSVSMAGLLFQRAGDTLDGTNWPFKKYASHLNPVNFPDQNNRVITGGHYDAGDYNPRAHWDIVQVLMSAYELTPTHYYDGQLDIPEKSNGIPDILDEAQWGLQVWTQLQDPADGGVGVDSSLRGIETPDPNQIETPERDPFIDQAYAKNAKGSFILAALGAQAARIWASIGKGSQAAVYLEAARRAYAFAKSKPTETSAAYKGLKGWAAGELARTTGEGPYTSDYLAAGFDRNNADLINLRATAAYAFNNHPNADPQVRLDMKNAIISIADQFVSNAATYAYPHIQHPYSPLGWGVGAYPLQLAVVTFAHALTGNANYLEWHVHSADMSLGVNPLNLTYTTGLGQRAIHAPLHLFGSNNYSGTMLPGLQCEGPYRDTYAWNGTTLLRAWHENNSNPGQSVYPSLANTPDAYQYYDVRFIPGTQEGVSITMALTAVAYGYLLPDL